LSEVLINPYRYEIPFAYWYNFPTQTNALGLCSQTWRYVILAHKNETGSTHSTTAITVYMAKIGSPSGTIYGGIWDNNSPNPVLQETSTNSISASSLTADSYGSYTAYDFTFDRTDVLDDWSVGVYSNDVETGDNFPAVAVAQDGAEVDETQLLLTQNIPTWTDTATQSLSIKIGG